MEKMSDQKKKPVGRGRGKVSNKLDGPWTRSKKLEDIPVVRRPKIEDDAEKKEFRLTQASFPPLPSSSNTDVITGENENSSLCLEKGELPTSSLEKTDAKEDTNCQESTGEISSGSGPDETKQEILPNKEEHPREEKKVCDQTNKEVLTKIVENKEVKNDSLYSVASCSYEKVNPSKDETVQSNLSPFAKEFVPRVGEQNMNINADMNPYADDFVPINLNCVLLDNEPVDEKKMKKLLSDVEENLHFCYSKINENPGIFTELMDIVKPHFLKYLRNPELTLRIVQVMYNFSLADESFTYHAVRMMVYLIDIASKKLSSSVLRDVLLKFAQEEVIHYQMEKLPYPNLDISHISSFLFFISELYIQLEVGNRRLSFIGTQIVETLRRYLEADHAPIKERFLNIMNIVKLTGTFLDQDDRSLLDQFLPEVQEKLYEERLNLDMCTNNMVGNLIRVRNANWGDHEDPPVETPPEFVNEIPQNVFENGSSYDINQPAVEQGNVAVFYGPDGHIMPYDEQLFLECNAQYHHSADEQSESSPGSMDEEMHVAYEEFLQTIPAQRVHFQQP